MNEDSPDTTSELDIVTNGKNSSVLKSKNGLICCDRFLTLEMNKKRKRIYVARYDLEVWNMARLVENDLKFVYINPQLAS